MNQAPRLPQSSVQNTYQVVQDNVTKAKNLMISLNISLENMFEAARSEINNEEKTPEQRVYFEKYFEDFYSILDQIELNLTTALKCVQQADNNRKYLPFPVNVNPQANSLSYNQFLNVAEAQAKYFDDILNILSFKEAL